MCLYVCGNGCRYIDMQILTRFLQMHVGQAQTPALHSRQTSSLSPLPISRWLYVQELHRDLLRRLECGCADPPRYLSFPGPCSTVKELRLKGLGFKFRIIFSIYQDRKHLCERSFSPNPIPDHNSCAESLPSSPTTTFNPTPSPPPIPPFQRGGGCGYLFENPKPKPPTVNPRPYTYIQELMELFDDVTKLLGF